MGYLKEFQSRLEERNVARFLQLWEEYLTVDSVDADEMKQLLAMIKKSDLAKPFGPHAESALPMWGQIQDTNDAYAVLRLIIDLETTNSTEMATLALEAIQKKYNEPQLFQEKLRLVGLRGQKEFQGALTNFDLLMHMQKGHFVFHTGGWGTGEIIDVSFLREQLTVEFENVSGKKELAFQSAFKTLVPLSDNHFLSARFGNPDKLEAKAKENPIEVIKWMLRDLGPKTSQEIKDELCELVIPDAEWTKWWQAARAKIKKDPIIENPESAKNPFVLRSTNKTPQEELDAVFQKKGTPQDRIEAIYTFLRDLPGAVKDPAIKEKINQALQEFLASESPALRLQAALLLKDWLDQKNIEDDIKKIISGMDNAQELIDQISVSALKKQALIAIRNYLPDWDRHFLDLLFSPQATPLKDYLLKSLNESQSVNKLQDKLQELLKKPQANPEMFFWYFQKIAQFEEGIPFQSFEGRCQFLESFLLLLCSIEHKPEWKDLTKKMYNLLSGKRYAVVRQLLQGTSKEFLEEFLLLTSKCHTLSDHDAKILRSLAAVVDPSLAEQKGSKNDSQVIWTTEGALKKIKEKIQHLGTHEIVENAKEIEVARAHGDLRENSEYKFALERRARLQSELKTLSEQINRTRVITPNDISDEEVNVGHIVDVEDGNQHHTTYTILGPWDANAETGILSSQSQMAQAMLGLKVGESFTFKDHSYKIVSFKTIFES